MASQRALGDCIQKVRKEPGYVGVLAGGEKNLKKKHVIKHHKILLVTHRKKEQTFQVNDFSAVLFMGRCKSLGSVKLFPFVHPNTVEPVSPFFFAS